MDYVQVLVLQVQEVVDVVVNMSCRCNKKGEEIPRVPKLYSFKTTSYLGDTCDSCSGQGDELKNKISCEFLTLLSYVERGKYPDYEFILEEISLLEVYNNLDKKDFLLQYYLNNPWETY